MGELSWQVSNEFFAEIDRLIKPGQTVLEFGSGDGTAILVQKYKVYSVEHDEKWLNKVAGSNYIYAPIRPWNKGGNSRWPKSSGWYDWSVLEKKLPKNYDLIIVDGPTGEIGRGGFYEFFDEPLHLKRNVPIVFDDAHRHFEHKLIMRVAVKLGCDATLKHAASSGRFFAVLNPRNQV